MVTQVGVLDRAEVTTPQPVFHGQGSSSAFPSPRFLSSPPSFLYVLRCSVPFLVLSHLGVSVGTMPAGKRRFDFIITQLRDHAQSSGRTHELSSSTGTAEQPDTAEVGALGSTGWFLTENSSETVQGQQGQRASGKAGKGTSPPRRARTAVYDEGCSLALARPSCDAVLWQLPGSSVFT